MSEETPDRLHAATAKVIALSRVDREKVLFLLRREELARRRLAEEAFGGGYAELARDFRASADALYAVRELVSAADLNDPRSAA